MPVPVYDIANCGPRHRFAANGKLVHNSDKVNLQNLPRGGQLRKALAAPDGHVVVACDSSQIEARLVAYLAGQDDLVQSFREGRDVYSEFATDVYGRPVTKGDKVERHVGKTCVAEGTLVLSDSGWKPIEAVTTNDRVWDGEEWVCHAGLAYNGMKQTLPLCGAWLTPDHLVWSGTQWREAGLLVHDVSTLSQALDTAAENLPSQAIFAVSGAGSVPSLSGVTVATTSTPSIPTTSKHFGQHVVRYAQRLRQTVSGIGRTLRSYLMMTTALACSTGYRLLSVGVTTPQTALTSTTVDGVFLSTRHGGTTEACSFATYRPSKGGVTLHGNSTGWIITPGMSRGTYGSQLVPRTRQTSGGSLNLRPVYDILNSGSRNRFTILTDAGPIIVHNCILGLGYGMGAAKFRHSLATGFISVKMDENEAQQIVRLYRNKYHRIQALWNRCGHALNGLVAGESGDMCDLIGYDAEGIILPNGLRIRYPALRRSANGFEYINDARTYRKFIRARVMGDEAPELTWTKLYGGKCLAGDTEVLTDKGWVHLRDVTRNHRVWDGVRWVKHDGLIYQGKKATTVVNGVRMTPDHNVLTERGWRCASSSEGLHRAGFWLPDGSEVSGDKWATLCVGLPVQLRDGSFSGGHQRGKVCPQWWAPVVRLQSWGSEQVARAIEASGVLGVAFHAGPVSAANAPSMAQLWGTGYQGMPGVGAGVRSVLGGHGANVSGGSDTGPEGQQRGLHPGELSVGDLRGAGGEPAQLTPSGYNQGAPVYGYFQIDAAVSLEPEPVYDLLNAGPNTRFVVRGSSGPFLAHNCVENITQAVARIVVSEQMTKIGRRYPVALQVHDEIVCVVPEEQADACKDYMMAVMSAPPKWAPDLPVACEAGVGTNYGAVK